MTHATSLFYHVHSVASRNKWFNPLLPELRKKYFKKIFDVILFRMGRKIYMIFLKSLIKKNYSTKALGGSPGELSEELVNPFSNLSITSPTSQLILQPFRRFTYITAYSPNLLLLHQTSQFILQPFCRLSYVTSSSLNSPGELFSFSNLPVTSPTSQLILQPFRCFTYVTVHSPTLLLLLLRHKLFT